MKVFYLVFSFCLFVYSQNDSVVTETCDSIQKLNKRDSLYSYDISNMKKHISLLQRTCYEDSIYIKTMKDDILYIGNKHIDDVYRKNYLKGLNWISFGLGIVSLIYTIVDANRTIQVQYDSKIFYINNKWTEYHTCLAMLSVSTIVSVVAIWTF
jgi:hypothetical protein